MFPSILRTFINLLYRKDWYYYHYQYPIFVNQMDNRSSTTLDEANNDNNKFSIHLETQPKEENEEEQFIVQELNLIDKEINSVIIRAFIL